MRVLVLSHHFPYDPRTNVNGVYQRLRLFLDAFKVTAELRALFYSPAERDASPAAARALARELASRWGVELELCLSPRTGRRVEIEALRRCLAGAPDLVFAHRLGVMRSLLACGKRLPPVFLDLDDVEHVALLRAARALEKKAKLAAYLKLPRLLWDEARALAAATRVFVCSERDRRRLALWIGGRRVVVVPNAVEPKPRLPLPPEPRVVFMGSYRYWPNVQAAEFLLREIWPRVRRLAPAARLSIAGPGAENIALFGREIPGVEFTGFVENVEDLYRRCRMVCCPVLAGSGTRVKILEAAAYGRAVVTTRIGAEGLELDDGSELLVRDEPQRFAEACAQLFSDDSLCERLGSAAQAAVRRRYDRATVCARIRALLPEPSAGELGVRPTASLGRIDAEGCLSRDRV